MSTITSITVESCVSYISLLYRSERDVKCASRKLKRKSTDVSAQSQHDIAAQQFIGTLRNAIFKT